MSSPDGRLAGRRAIVTGGASGIGHATARLFAAEGARVAIVDHNAEGAAAAAAAIGAERASAFALDVSDEQQVERVSGEAVEWLGGLDTLVNCAAISGTGHAAPIGDVPLEVWRSILDVNLTGTYLVMRAALPHLTAAGGGAIVNVASTYAIVVGRDFGAYSASKGGVVQLTKSVAVDYAKAGVRANAIAPGFVDTPLLRGDLAADPDPEAAREDIVRRIPQGKLMTAEQVAPVILFLASDDAEIVTGSLLVADGGFTTL
jgi:meso-butanediol dehydrogenase / (S,S)-butanediol dehydrogenase / diacetyl reductase